MYDEYTPLRVVPSGLRTPKYHLLLLVEYHSTNGLPFAPRCPSTEAFLSLRSRRTQAETVYAERVSRAGPPAVCA